MEKFLCEKSLSKLDLIFIAGLSFLFGAGVISFLGLIVLLVVTGFVVAFFEHKYTGKLGNGAPTVTATGIELAGLADKITDHLCEQEYDIGGRDELLRHVREAIDAAMAGEVQS